jgi:hypothetical protein
MPQPELHELETFLRELRPAPDPGWATRLDARAARGFPAPPAFWRRPLIAGREHLVALTAVGGIAAVMIVIVGGLATLTNGSGKDNLDRPASLSAGEVAKATPASGSAEKSAGAASSSKDSAAAVQPASGSADAAPRTAAPSALSTTGIAPARRPVAHTVTLTLAAAPKAVEDVADGVIRVTDSLGGYVQDSSVSAGGKTASADLSLRIPAAKLQDGLTQLSRLAHVRRRTQQAEDLTDQRSALEATVRDARASRDSLRARLAHSTSDREAARLRARLARAERTVTARERTVAQLNQKAALATVEVHVSGDRSLGAAPKPAATSGGRWTPGDALRDAGRVLEVAAGVGLIALAVALPVAIVAFLALLASRLLVRRRRERALELA